jgi:hypothetical protein
MVARPRSPDGNNVAITIKVSDNAAAAIDSARGGLTRSAWVRGTLLAMLGTSPVAATATVPPAAGTEPRKPQRAEAVKVPPVLAAAGLVPASLLPKPRRCSHPGKRSVGGWCDDCDHRILIGGEWA